MIRTARAFGYLRINGPDDERLDAGRLELSHLCRRQGWQLANVFCDHDPEHADTGWLGFAQLLNAVHQRPNSVVVVPEATHLGTGTVTRDVLASCMAVARATLWIGWSSPTPIAAASDGAAVRLWSPVGRLDSEVR